jgi:DNA-binding GntR family transcriptional regulator
MLHYQRPRGLVESIVRALSEAIWSGRLAPGSKIHEEQMASEFGTSRSPVREAMRVLASKGLVVIQPNRGARVVEITESRMRDLYGIRSVLEGLAARLATDRATIEDIEELRASSEAMRAAVIAKDQEAYFDANQGFHSAVARLSGNERLCELLDDWPVQIYRLFFPQSYLDPSHVGLYIGSHDAVIEAFERRDAESAERLMSRHADDSLQEALRLIRARGGDSSDGELSGQLNVPARKEAPVEGKSHAGRPRNAVANKEAPAR